MIQILSLAFGAFPEIESLNRAFSPGQWKLRITVDAETHPRLPDDQLLGALVAAFPGLARHQCRVDGAVKKVTRAASPAAFSAASFQTFIPSE